MNDKTWQDVLNEAFADIMPKSPSYQYWSFRDRKDSMSWRPRRYAYTTERATDSHVYLGKEPAFFAMVYERIAVTKQGETWKKVRTVRFAVRKLAKARAYKWFQDDCRHLRVGGSGHGEQRTGYCKACSAVRPAPPEPGPIPGTVNEPSDPPEGDGR